MSPQALSSNVWDQASGQVGKVLNDGREFVRVSAEISVIFKKEAWRTDGTQLKEQFAHQPGAFSDQGFEAIAKLCELLPRFLTSAHALRTLLGTAAAPTTFSISRLISIGERVADAPDASPDAFVAAIWERGLEQAGDLADGVEQLRTVRKELEGKVPSPSLRRIEMIPPMEIAAGIKEILESSLGASEEEIVLMVSRRLGFKATSSVLRDLIASRIKHLSSSQILKDQNGIFMAAKGEGQ